MNKRVIFVIELLVFDSRFVIPRFVLAERGGNGGEEGNKVGMRDLRDLGLENVASIWGTA